MSFSKAKIQRFNDIKDCTPSPAKYNINTQEKAKLGIIAKAGKYSKKPGSPQSSESSSVQSTPCFQTPTLPVKKKKLLGMSFKSTVKNSDAEELREKIVECNNKDLYIKDLIEQIEEMTGRISALQLENTTLKAENERTDGELQNMKKQNLENKIQRAKEYTSISDNLKDVNEELKHIRRKYEDLKNQNFVELTKLLAYIGQFEELYNKMVAENREEMGRLKKEHIEEKNSLEDRIRECEKEKEDFRQQYLEGTEKLKKQFHENKLRECQIREEIQQNYLKRLQEVKNLHNEEKMNLENQLQGYKKQIEDIEEEVKHLKEHYNEEKEELEKKLDERTVKILLLEENFKDVNLLTDLQMKQKTEEIEELWKQKLADKEAESNAILKECQEISEYSIIQCELEKNQIIKELEKKKQDYEEIEKKCSVLEEEVNNLKTEKHAYELSISTFRDTIEVLKKRLISSDRDVVQLKEELEKCEEKILNYERKCTELTNQLSEVQNANEELEMQYESTSKLMQNHVENTEKTLLAKVDLLKKESEQLLKDRELLHEVLAQHHEQQVLLCKAQAAIAESTSFIDALEQRQIELEYELRHYKEDAEEAAEIRKKYIEKSGKLDELAQQFEQVLQELDQNKARVQELEEHLEAYRNELKVLNDEKETIANEAKELSLKYADLLGHQNHLQKIKYVKDLKIKSSELFQKNLDLEAKNYKLSKLVDKLMKDNDDLRKITKKGKVATEDKENLPSPKCVKGTQSPGPLKDKN